MRRFLKKFNLPVCFIVFLYSTHSYAASDEGYGRTGFTAEDPDYTGVLHPPVIASYKGIKIAVLFLESKLRGEINNYHVGGGEVYYMPVQPLKAELHRVWRVEGDEIASVFFDEWKDSSGEKNKSLYILTKTKEPGRSFQGYYYTALEYPLIAYKGVLSLNFSPKEPQWDALASCMDGINLETNEAVVCPYKDAASIKKFLASQHDQKK